MLSPVDDAGIFTEEAGQFQGLQVGCSSACMLSPLCQMRSLLTHLQNWVVCENVISQSLSSSVGCCRLSLMGLQFNHQVSVVKRCMLRQHTPASWLLATCSSPLPPPTECTFPTSAFTASMHAQGPHETPPL